MIFKFYPTVCQVVRGDRLALVDHLDKLHDYEVGYGGWPAAFLNWHAAVKKLHGDVVVQTILKQGLEPNMKSVLESIGAPPPDPRIPGDMLEIWVATGGRFIDDALVEFGKATEDGSQLRIVESDVDAGEPEVTVDPNHLDETGFSYVANAIQHRGSELVSQEGQSSPGRTLNGPLWPRWDMLPVIKLKVHPSLTDFATGAASGKYCELLCRQILDLIPWKAYPNGFAEGELAKLGAYEVMRVIFGSQFDANGRTTSDPYGVVSDDAERSFYWQHGTSQIHWADPDDVVKTHMEQMSQLLIAAYQGNAPWVDMELSNSSLLNAPVSYAPHQAATPTDEWTSAAWADGRITYPWYLPWCTEEDGLVGYIDGVEVLYSCYRHLALQAAAISTEDTRIKQLVSSGAVDGDEDVTVKKKPLPTPAKKGSILPWLLGGAAVIGAAAAASSNKQEQNPEGAAEPSKE